MCDTGEIMAQQMDDQIEAGNQLYDNMCEELDYLKKKVKMMEGFLHPWELKAIENMLKNSDHEKVKHSSKFDGLGHDYHFAG